MNKLCQSKLCPYYKSKLELKSNSSEILPVYRKLSVILL